MKKKVFEIRYHARAGQGSKTAAQLVAEAGMAAGRFIQAFPFYGPEREGAPMMAFTRLSEEPIRLHSLVEHPDLVVVIDQTMVCGDVLEGMGPEGTVIANSAKSSVELKEELKCEGTVIAVDANEISRKYLGRVLPNTTMLGALAFFSPLIKLEDLIEVLEKKFSKKLGPEMTSANIKAVKEGYAKAKEG